MPSRRTRRNPAKLKSQNTQQHVYATNLDQNLGYPLRIPQPDENLGLPYSIEGFQIGDVGYVDQYGAFHPLFNIKFPSKKLQETESPQESTRATTSTSFPEELERVGLQHNFDQPGGKQAVGPNTLFMSGVEKSVGVPRSSVAQQSYRFTANKEAGAILILPTGAMLFELKEKHLGPIRNYVTRYAAEWCEEAQRDSLYLVTAAYKTTSWTLGSFEDGIIGKDILVHRDDDATPVYTWDPAFNVDSQQGRKGNHCHNQAVFIKGFKMTVRRHRSADVNTPDGWLARLLADLQLMAGKWLSKQKIEYFPALNFSQPSHPLDVVNNVLLDKNPGAQIAVTHDDDWIEMLGKGLEFSQLMEEGPVRNFMTQKRYTFDLDTRHSAIYLQRNIGGNADLEHRSQTFRGELEPSPVHEETGCGRNADEGAEVPSDDSRLVITNMRLESFEVDCIDAGVCVLVQFGTTTRRSKNKPHADIVEWDDEIMLPSDIPIYVTVCGIFQLGSTLGTREISSKHTINTRDLSGNAHKIRFLVGNTTSCSSLLITLERHFSYSEAHLSEDEKSIFVEKTTLGFEAFYSHHRDHQEKDLEGAVEHFRDARKECNTDPTRHATACFNLATCEFIRCQTYGMYSKLNVPIDLYRKALESRGDGHSDRPATLLLLAQALLSRHGQAYDESIAEEIEALLTELDHDDSRDRQSADAIIATCRFYRALNSEDPSGVDGLLTDLERDTYVPSYGYFDRPHVIHKLGLAFWRRFRSLANLDDLDKSIKLNAAALPFTPDGHDDRKNVVDCLGNSFLCGIEARGELSDLDMSIGLAEVGKKVLTKLDDLMSTEGAQGSSDKLREQKELMTTAEELWERIELMPAAEKLDEQIELLLAAETLRERIEHTSAVETLRKQIERMSAADYALQAIIAQEESLDIPEIQNLVEDWGREEGTPTECKRQLAVLLSFLEGDGDVKMRDVLEELDFEWPYKDHKIAGTSRALQAHRSYFNSVLTTQLRRSMDGWA